VRIKFARPRKEGALYGARVYIDSGDGAKTKLYTWWSDENVDSSKADHYFWLNPGKTEHTIQGFYKSPTKVQRFEFAEPTRKRIREEDNPEGLGELDTIGTIRIMFCKVDGFEKRDENLGMFTPKQAAIDPRLDEKIRISAKPGRVLKDGCGIGTRSAILSHEILYERRLIYNSYEGFKARNLFQRHTQKVDFYKGMPLEAFLNRDVRISAITTFFRNVNTTRFDLTTAQLAEQANAGVAQTGPGGSMIEDVYAQDIVHYICESLSPAASYIICTGRMKPGNYGEVSVQRSGAPHAEKFQDYYDKERGLVAHFMAEPGSFDLELVIVDPKRRSKENYKVKFVVVQLIDDSSDEE
jgi:hypothetical protein